MDLLVQLVPKGPLDYQGLRESKDELEILERLENLECRVCKELLDRRDLVVTPG